jgi:glycine/D-amino acid oxidase-like deaminating enzyme
LENAFVAAGHYRSGLATSTGTALLMRQLMCGQPLEIDIEQFRLDR